MITTQRELRRAFWESHPNVRRGTSANGDYVTDTRVAFVEFVDMLARDGQISEELAHRVTL